MIQMIQTSHVIFFSSPGYLLFALALSLSPALVCAKFNEIKDFDMKPQISVGSFNFSIPTCTLSNHFNPYTIYLYIILYIVDFFFLTVKTT